MAYPIDPLDVVKEIEVQFHFTAEVTDQVALLFFLGQEGFHEYGSDYIALSYVKGHILLTWDLGAGPRRIFTKRPVDERYFVHSVQFGRHGRLGFLQVDNFPNITGRAPGIRENLNISSKVIIHCSACKYHTMLMIDQAVSVPVSGEDRFRDDPIKLAIQSP